MAEEKGLAPNERKIVIDTPRLEIRTYRPEDKEFILSTWGDRENGKYMCDPARENMDEKYLGLIDKMPDTPDGFYFVAWLKENGKPVGTCCAFPENGNYDIGYCIGRKWWHNGITPEALTAVIAFLFDQVHVRCVRACHDTNNPNSGKVMIKSGMKYDGLRRQAGVNNQGIIDEAWYSILRSEYENGNSQYQ